MKAMPSPTEQDYVRLRQIINIQSNATRVNVVLMFTCLIIGSLIAITDGFSGAVPYEWYTLPTSIAAFLMVYVPVRLLFPKGCKRPIMSGVHHRLLPSVAMGVLIGLSLTTNNPLNTIFFSMLGIMSLIVGYTFDRGMVHDGIVAWMSMSEDEKRKGVSVSYDVEIEHMGDMLIPNRIWIHRKGKGYLLEAVDPYLTLNTELGGPPSFDMKVAKIEDLLDNPSKLPLKKYSEIRDFSIWVVFSEVYDMIREDERVKSAELKFALNSL